LKIDHVTLAGPRLQEMRDAFSAATGIPTEYGGPHSNHVTEMALASFPDGSYVELVGIQERADPAALAAHTWARFLCGNSGPCAFALRVADVNAEAQRLRGAGIRVGETEKSGRTRPDGVTLSWETAEVGAGPLGSFFPFLIRDFTPRQNRVYPSVKPTSTHFSGVGLVVIGVHNLEAAIAQYRKAFQLPEPKRQRDESFGADLAWLKGTPVALAASLAPDSWLAHRIQHFGESPCAFVLTVASGITVEQQSIWFGRALSWLGDAKLGWRIGILGSNPRRLGSSFIGGETSPHGTARVGKRTLVAGENDVRLPYGRGCVRSFRRAVAATASSVIERETPPRASAGDRVERPRRMFAPCSIFVRLSGFFAKFRGPKAHSNRPGGLSHIEFPKSRVKS
jgi:hypothetical protein